ncbi:MAG: heavy metal translocating P-type ATPase [Kofleriaceae bacterium]
MTTVDLPVLGMTCAACVRRVEKAVAAVPGVASADVNLALSRARVELDPSALEHAVAAIRDAGYEVPADVLDTNATGASRLAAIEDATREDKRTLRRDAIVAIALTVPLLVIAMSHALSGIPIVIAQLVLGTLVVLGPGRRYFRAGLAAVLHKSPDMNTLIALGAGAAWLSSTVTSARWFASPHQHHMPALYFEAGAAIIAFVMIGKLLEARARSRLADAVRGLLSMSPTTAHLVDGATTRDVDAASLSPGASILVRPGERIPADGTIVEGTSALDESMLTGESLPVDKSEGAPVYAGTLNHHGALTVRVARAGSDTALSRIARAVEDAQGQKAPIARIADRVSAVFVPIVLAIALLTFAAWAIATDPSVGLERAIAVLVIACPCALGLATPAAVAVGTARGAELGILFRSGAALERGARVDIVALDKTGTLTANAPTVTRVVGHNRNGDEMLRFAASAEQSSEHPIARAIVAAVLDARLPSAGPSDPASASASTDTPMLSPASAVVAEPGRGVTALVDGHRIRVGSRQALALAGIDPVPLDHAVPAGATICYVAIDDELAGLIAVSDPPSHHAKPVIAALRAMDIEPVMITGDRDEVARTLAGEVGITHVHAGVAPTQKAAIVRALREGRPATTARAGTSRNVDGVPDANTVRDTTDVSRNATNTALHRVAMVGDGINDAPALAAADLGIALATGTDIAAAAADVTLLRGGLSSLPTALALARATMRTIRQNLVAAFAYNAICIPIAAGVLYPVTGWQLSPVIASAAMSLSSVSVLASSLRLRRFAR